MADASGKPIKLDRPIKLQWPSGHSAANVNKTGTTAIKKSIVPPQKSYCLPVHTAQNKKYTPVHACCTTCTTKKHISQCLNICDSCDETKDLEHVYVLSPHSSISNDTSPAMLYALPPQWQERTAVTDTRDVGEGGEAEDAHRPVRGATQSTSPAQIFLDSGCIAGNYIREDLANKLVRKLPHFYTHAITNVCGAFGECQLSKKKLHIRVKIFEDGSYKEFDSDFKVLRKLPYEVIVGRRDMVKHRLTLPQNESEKDVPR